MGTALTYAAPTTIAGSSAGFSLAAAPAISTMAAAPVSYAAPATSVNAAAPAISMAVAPASVSSVFSTAPAISTLAAAPVTYGAASSTYAGVVAPATSVVAAAPAISTKAAAPVTYTAAPAISTVGGVSGATYGAAGGAVGSDFWQMPDFATDIADITAGCALTVVSGGTASAAATASLKIVEKAIQAAIDKLTAAALGEENSAKIHKYNNYLWQVKKIVGPPFRPISAAKFIRELMNEGLPMDDEKGDLDTFLKENAA